jgi:hypothetical protein
MNSKTDEPLVIESAPLVDQEEMRAVYRRLWLADCLLATAVSGIVLVVASVIVASIL